MNYDIIDHVYCSGHAEYLFVFIIFHVKAKHVRFSLLIHVMNSNYTLSEKNLEMMWGFHIY